jgi:hypothetical protein
VIQQLYEVFFEANPKVEVLVKEPKPTAIRPREDPSSPQPENKKKQKTPTVVAKTSTAGVVGFSSKTVPRLSPEDWAKLTPEQRESHRAYRVATNAAIHAARKTKELSHPLGSPIGQDVAQVLALAADFVGKTGKLCNSFEFAKPATKPAKPDVSQQSETPQNVKQKIQFECLVQYYTDFLCYSFTVPVLFDTECRPFNVITERCVRRLRNITVESLLKPIPLSPFGPNRLLATTSLKLRVILEGAGAKRLIFPIQALVVNHDADFLILGGQLLEDLGLWNIGDALDARLRNTGEGSDVLVEAASDDLPTHSLAPSPTARYRPSFDGLADAKVFTLYPPIEGWSGDTVYCKMVKLVEARCDALTNLKGPDPDRTRRSMSDMLLRALDMHYATKFPVPFTVFIDLVCDYSDIFRVGLDGTPPTTLPPMKLTLVDENQKPVMTKRRAYTRPKAQFLSAFVQELIKYDLVQPDFDASWSSAAMAVPKGDSFRLVQDYVRVNQVLVPISWPMPRMQESLELLVDSKYFGKFDLDNCYWQFAVEPSSRKFLSFITPDKVVTPKRMPMGIHNAVAHLQMHLSTLLEDIKDQVQTWLDDILLHSKSPDTYVEGLKKLFSRLRSVNLLLQPEKVTLIAEAVEWLGRIVSAAGVKFHPRQLEPLLAMEAPTTAADLQQFVCAAQWFKLAIPDFARIIHPLQDLLLCCTRVCDSSKKTKLERLMITDRWSSDHQVSFQQIKDRLRNTMVMSYVKEGGIICVFTDASSTHWGVIVTQVMEWDSTKNIHSQAHLPLAMLSGAFTGSELLAHIVEKEAYAINEAVSNLGYILARREGFRLFTDHRNLVFMVDPKSVSNVLRKNSIDKIARWACNLFSLNFEIFHIAGVDNVWADLLTRWGSGDKLVSTDLTDMEGIDASGRVFLISETHPRYKSLHNLNYSTSEETYEFPSIPELVETQDQCASERSKSTLQFSKVNSLWTVNGKVWIPFSMKQLHIRLLVVAHCGASGHPRYELTLKSLTELYFWVGMEDDIKSFCSSCMQCQLFNANKSVPRPFGDTIVASKPNMVLEFDYLYIQESVDGFQYLLVIKDKFSGYTMLIPSKEADSSTAVVALLMWDSLFGVSGQTWVSDQGSHFKNRLVKAMSDALMLKEHHFTTAYCPWSNGSVERLNRTVLVIIRKLLSENHIPDIEWSRVVHLLMKIINETPSTARGGFTPRKLFTMLDTISPLAQTLHGFDAPAARDLHVPPDFDVYVSQLQQDLDSLHDNVFLKVKRNVTVRQGKRLADKAVHITKFHVGDLVLRANVTSVFRRKLVATWTGPYRIVDTVNDWVFKLQDLLDPSKIVDVHIMRMRLFVGQSLVTDDLLEQIRYDRKEVTYEKFLSLSHKQGKFFLLTKWLGFSDTESTEETLESCYEHQPAMVLSYINALSSIDVGFAFVSRVLAFCRQLDNRTR